MTGMEEKLSRAARRRIERAARKANLQGMTSTDMAAALRAAEREDDVARKVREEAMACRIARKENEWHVDEIRKAAAQQAYRDWQKKFEKMFVEAMLVSMALAVHDKFPRWSLKAVNELVSAATAWNDRFITEYRRDITAFKNLYAIVFGEPMSVTLVDLDKPMVNGEGVPKSDVYKVTSEYDEDRRNDRRGSKEDSGDV